MRYLTSKSNLSCSQHHSPCFLKTILHFQLVLSSFSQIEPCSVVISLRLIQFLCRVTANQAFKGNYSN